MNYRCFLTALFLSAAVFCNAELNYQNSQSLATTASTTNATNSVVGKWKLTMDSSIYGIFDFRADGSMKVTMYVKASEKQGRMTVTMSATASYSGQWEKSGTQMILTNQPETFETSKVSITVTGGTAAQNASKKAEYTPYMDQLNEQFSQTLYQNFAMNMTETVTYSIISSSPQQLKVKTEENNIMNLYKVK